MKRTLLLLFALVAMGLSNVWAYQFSAVAPSGQTLYYNITGGNAVVTYQNSGSSSYSNLTGALEIPSTVTYNDNTYSVTSIGNYAFLWCSGLTSVTIPNSVTSIGNNAFYGCSGLTSVTIPNSVTSIRNEAFGGTAFYNNNSNWTNGVLYIGNYLIKANSDAIPSSYSIVDGTRVIADNAFSGCSGLTSVTIPNSVTSIGNWAFYYCSGLTSVTIPNSVTGIGYDAFYLCSSITSIIVESGNTHYDSRNNCNAIIETSTHTLIFGCKNTTIPNSVTTIGNNAFSYCSGLTSVTIPNSVTSIGDWAFYECSGLTSVTIGNSVTEIGEESFGECSRLTSIYSLSVNPPDVESNTFDGVYKNIPLKVPVEAVQTYTYAYGWRDFTNIIGISTQGIDEVEGSVIRCMGDRVIVNGAVNEMISIFDITGRMIVHEKAIDGKAYPMPHSGVYMVQVGNHPAEKVVVIR